MLCLHNKKQRKEVFLSKFYLSQEPHVIIDFLVYSYLARDSYKMRNSLEPFRAHLNSVCFMHLNLFSSRLKFYKYLNINKSNSFAKMSGKLEARTRFAFSTKLIRHGAESAAPASSQRSSSIN